MKNKDLLSNFSVQELESRYEMRAWIRIRRCTNTCEEE